jgi:capsular polysaccharide export protein
MYEDLEDSRAVTFSRGIASLPYLNEFLGIRKLALYPPFLWKPSNVVLGWGHKPNTHKAFRCAERHGLPFYRLEDGFVRSVGLGKQGYPSISLVVDPVGIYYDYHTPSALEQFLNGGDALFTGEILETAQQAMGLIVEHNISKYNGGPNAAPEHFQSGKTNVLLVDQVAGDSSLIYGMPEGFNLSQMITAAKDENPHAQLYVKLHPETIAGFRAGCFDAVKNESSIRFITDDFNPLSVLKCMDRVYVGTSLMGFEALMLGKSVVCFGMPFYAGWGLTDDRMYCSRRIRKRSVLEVFAAAYLLYSRYVNPQTGQRCSILDALRFLIREIENDRRNHSDFFCFGIRHWKRYNVLPYLKSTRNRVVFVSNPKQAKRKGLNKNSQIVLWGARSPQGLDELLRETGRMPWRMEDGFLRSVGLGSDLVRPLSLVLDSEGIYFDSSKPSQLERLLSSLVLTPQLQERAVRIREKIVRMRLTKYNTEPHLALDLSAPKGKRRILVPGQVETDASIKLGCPEISTNIALLESVRVRNPDAFIIYKPHPDVVSGNRKGMVSRLAAATLCDWVVDPVNIPDCLECVEEVHTMTSLVGFEALLRGLKVVVYGTPFYAGWGLTEDRISIPRRTRKLTLDELVAGTLLLYPRYYDWQAGCWTNCEGAIDRLISVREIARQARGMARLQPSYVERQIRKLGLLFKGIAYAR